MNFPLMSVFITTGCRAAVECQVTKLVAEMDPKTGQKLKRPPMFARSGAVVVARIAFEQPIPGEFLVVR